jgi:hypothetical protein
MYCVAYRNPNSGKQDLSKADEIVDSLLEVKKAFPFGEGGCEALG